MKKSGIKVPDFVRTFAPYYAMLKPVRRTVKTIVEEGAGRMRYFPVLISACEYFREARIRQWIPLKAMK